MKNTLSLFIMLMVIGCGQISKNNAGILGKWILAEPISMGAGMEMIKLDTEFTENGNVIVTTGMKVLGQYTEGTASGTYKSDGNKIIYSTGAVFEINETTLESKVPTANGEVSIKLKKSNNE